MTARIFSEKNFSRPTEVTFLRFVEACAILTKLSRGKKVPVLDLTGALCKALAWYFPLLAKLRVRSVEALIFRKFPQVCPYCMVAPHDPRICKLSSHPSEAAIDLQALRIRYREGWAKRPRGLDEWRLMFDEVYPRTFSDKRHFRSILGLVEEVGEAAEAVRLFYAIKPNYLLAEAADVFSYLMGLANEESRKGPANLEIGHLGLTYVKTYPGRCRVCGHEVCGCPEITDETIGRLAREIPIASWERPFVREVDEIHQRGRGVVRRHQRALDAIFSEQA